MRYDDMLIVVRDVYKIYAEGQESEVRALAGVDLEIAAGEYVSIIGASGSGKSTLMNILGCLDVPTRGEYYLDGVDVGQLDDRELSRIRSLKVGFVFQGYNLIPTLNAFENVELPLIYQGVTASKRRQAVEEALDRVGLIERMEHRPSALSGGQQQRVAIARAIAAKAPVIMADEPTGALDSKTGAQIMEILSELNQSGSTVLLITHDIAISQQADRLIRLKDGRIISDGPKEAANG
jgi:putative ABC transport system ATP-binding protein